MEKTDLQKVIEYIDPGELGYQEWVNVGMALKQEGYPVSVWSDWSRRDFGRYHEGECEKKWNSFRGNSSPVTGGTIVQMAKDHGWIPEYGHELDWDDSISRDDEQIVVDQNWIEEQEVREPEKWDPVKELTTYLGILFEASENVGYVTGSWEKTDEKGKRWLPQQGSWDRTAGQLIELLEHCNGDIANVVGDCNPEAGAWIRFNPLDGNGCKNENVTEYRYALVESDSMNIDRQNAIIRELQLPVACLVYSGKKSLHAIVRVDAADYTEYRKRVDYLYNICEKNGLKADTQNRNPSRLSR
ncbi:MAG: PriCT-2 domain-containing protein, partial [Clostridiales bacterium]|nr:PriCT-2 domain-containing protein [Clostridiales bacterium]